MDPDLPSHITTATAVSACHALTSSMIAYRHPAAWHSKTARSIR